MANAATATGLPFDDIRTVVQNLSGGDERAVAAVAARNDELFGAEGAGRLGKLCEWLAAWSGKSPSVTRPLVALFAGTHAAQGAQAQGNVAAQIARIAQGGAPINHICSSQELGLKVFDLALAYPVANIAEDAALNERDCAATIAFGMEAVAGGLDLMVAGSCMPQAGFSPAAIFLALHGGPVTKWTDDPGDAAIANAAVAFHGAAARDPLEALRRLGGRETAAIAGAILAARVQHVPLFLDGRHALAAAAVLQALDADAISHCMLAQGHGSMVDRCMAEALGMVPLLDLSMRLDSGEGGALAMMMARSAAAMHGAELSAIA